MTYGFVENTAFSGLFSYGVDCRFEPWAKIECFFNPVGFSPRKIRRLDRISRGLSRLVLWLGIKIRFISPTLRLTRVLKKIRNKWFFRKRINQPKFDAFVLECYSPENEPFQLHMQCDQEEKLLSLRSFKIVPGFNYHVIPFSEFKLSHAKARIFLFPENDRPCRLVFTWLDFVRFANKPAPAEKVKCVVWDLDNTIWQGVLIEEGSDGVRLNQQAIDTIRQLDQRGVVHTIVSKNTYQEAWTVLEKFGISEYFIYPAINWGAKSENIKELASRINLGLDSFAVVDDSPQERAEIAFTLPMVRLYSDKQIAQLPSLPEFDIPVTEMSVKRRQSYLTQMKREEIQTKFSDDYDAFLRSLEIKMEIFKPVKEAERKRCYELLQRSNQLNLSTRLYSLDEYNDLLSSNEILCYAFRCWDKFGDYGIVGFISITLEDIPRIQDLVISCRIAQKHVEHALIHWVSQKLKQEGYRNLLAHLIITKRNSPLVAVFQDLPFIVIEENNKSILYKIPDLEQVENEHIITTTFRNKELIDESHN
jgi:FkbH-like protein